MIRKIKMREGETFSYAQGYFYLVSLFAERGGGCQLEFLDFSSFAAPILIKYKSYYKRGGGVQLIFSRIDFRFYRSEDSVGRVDDMRNRDEIVKTDNKNFLRLPLAAVVHSTLSSCPSSKSRECLLKPFQVTEYSIKIHKYNKYIISGTVVFFSPPIVVKTT